MIATRRLLGLLGIVVLLAGPAQAGHDPERDAVEGLLRAGSPGERAEPTDEALAGLLASAEHDPWRLVEHLLAHGRPDVAQRLARQTEESVIGPLSTYAQETDAAADRAERARLLGEVFGAIESNDCRTALERIDRLRALPGRAGVFGVDAESLRSTALAGLGRAAESEEARLRAGEEALQLGWWGGASWLFEQALEVTFQAGNLDLATRAAEGTRTVLEARGDGESLAAAVQNLGSLSMGRGDLPGALRHFDEALSRYELLGRSADVAEIRSLRSWVLGELGDFRAALDEQRALALYFVDRPHDAAWADNQMRLGLLRYRLGDETGAASAVSLAMQAHTALGDLQGAAHAQGNLGLIHAMGGHWYEALEAYRAALTTSAALGDGLLAARAKGNMADALQWIADEGLRAAALSSDPAERAARHTSARADLARARTLMEEALPILREAGAASMTCAATHTLGQILLADGRPKEALALLEPVRDEAARLRSWQTSVVATATLAQARLQLGDGPGALREARLAADELGRAFSGLAEADLARARALKPDVFDIGVSAAVLTKSVDDLAYFLEAGRASALLRGLGGRAAALRATVAQAHLDRLAASTRAKVAAFATWQEARKSRPTEARGLWTQYETRRETEQRLLEEIQRLQAEAANRLAPSRLISIRELQARLRNTARPGLRQVFALFNVQATEALALLVEESSARVVTYPSADLGALRAACSTLSASRRGELDPEALATVRRLLIDPLKIPAGPTRLFVSPDRDLAYVPLSAVVPDDWEVAWEPSATTYDLLAERRLRRGQRVLGLGDPDYGAVPDADALATRGGPRLVRLPGSRAEIEAIAGRPDDRRLLFAEATESGLKRALEADGPDRPWRSIHFACHGLVDVEWPALSCLALTPGDGEDGFLMSNEVLRLPLKTDLAVLSACQTGRGAFVRGEGVMSLTRAFMFAGAPRTIVSLWDVDDQATSFLMQAFYKEWTAGRGTAQALRSAQLAVRDHEVEETIAEPGKPPRQETRRPWSDPKFWAAWALWGLAD